MKNETLTKTECISCDGYGHPCTCKKAEPLKVGDVMCSEWGYGQNNVNFYVVTRRTKCTVTLVNINSVVVENIGWAHDLVEPSMRHVETSLECCSNLRMKGFTNLRIKGEGTQDAQVKISSYQYASLYDGTPKTRTSEY